MNWLYRMLLLIQSAAMRSPWNFLKDVFLIFCTGCKPIPFCSRAPGLAEGQVMRGPFFSFSSCFCCCFLLSRWFRWRQIVFFWRNDSEDFLRIKEIKDIFLKKHISTPDKYMQERIFNTCKDVKWLWPFRSYTKHSEVYLFKSRHSKLERVERNIICD